MPAITSGAELVKKLAESGTGADKLAPARSALEAAGKDVPAKDVVAALEAAGVPDMTLDKAKSFAATGEWAGPAAERAVPIEEQILAAKAKAKAEK